MPLVEAVAGALGGRLIPLCAGVLGADGRIDAPLAPGSIGAMLGLEGRAGGSPGMVTGAKLTPLRRASSRNSDSPAAWAWPCGWAAGGGMAGAVTRGPGGTLCPAAGGALGAMLGGLALGTLLVRLGLGMLLAWAAPWGGGRVLS